MNRYVEFHLGKTIALSALSELLTEISIRRFQGFVRVNEVGEGRFMLSFPRSDSADVALITLIREKPSQLYAERNVACLGDWVLDVYAAEIAARTGALVATDDNGSLHVPSLRFHPNFAGWLMDDPQRASRAQEHYARYSPVVPLPVRGIID